VVTIFYPVVAISVGAAVGALLRYVLSLALNPLLPVIPLGTLAANLIAAYVVGVAIEYLGGATSLSPVWRLLLVTGFAGGLSTFSTFSAELLTLVRDARWGWSTAMLAAHVVGSLGMTVLGMLTASLVRQQP